MNIIPRAQKTRGPDGLIIAAAIGALTGCPPPTAADAIDDLTSGWYDVEVIVFQRTTVTDANSPEQLIRTDERRVPANTQSLSFGALTNAYELDPLTGATLAFPVLTLNCPASPARNDGASNRPVTMPARYRPPPPNAADPVARRQSDDTPARPATARKLGSGAALDIPLLPSAALSPCARPPGRPPPTIAPKLEPHPLLDWLRAVRRFERQLWERSYRASLDRLRLGREASRIRNSGLRLLWHGRWTQPVPSRNAPQPMLLQAGRPINGGHELEGTLTITRGGFLRFHAKLWLNQAMPTTALAGTAAAPPHMVLEEQRVMRKGSLHYLDHPKLGVLARADPVEPPGWLIDALAAFESAKRGD